MAEPPAAAAAADSSSSVLSSLSFSSSPQVDSQNQNLNPAPAAQSLDANDQQQQTLNFDENRDPAAPCANPASEEAVEPREIVAAENENSLISDKNAEGIAERVAGSKLNAEAPEFVPRALASAEDATSPRAPPPQAFTEELRHKIVKQIEFYFSDANLATDKHLLKHVKKDPEGFVPIAVLASFRKVKNLVNNVSLVTAALLTSSNLVVSDDRKKVRRLHPLPEVDIAEVQSRTVVAENLPNDHSIENLEKLFGSIGRVKMVRVFPPHSYEAGHGSGKNHYRNEKRVSNKLHALVEYESVEQAEKAVSELNDERNWRSGLHVEMLSKRMVKYGHQTKPSKQADSAETHTQGEEDDAEGSPHDDVEGDGQHSNDKNGGKRGRGRGRGKARGRGHYVAAAPNGRGQTVNSVSNEGGASKQPRGPRMPDGTRGFTMGRGRPIVDTSTNTKTELP